MKQFESFRLDTSNQCLWRSGARIALPPKPFAVLRYLVENPGRLISHDELLDALWPETFVQPQVLRTYMLELRKVLGDDAAKPRFIQTMSKRGYCFVAPVTDEPCARPRLPVPTRPQDTGAIAGREKELAHLLSQVEQLAGGERRGVFVAGEAGIGKTALVDAFCRQLDPSFSARVARGQCVQGVAEKEPYYPVTEAICRLCSAPDGDTVIRTLARMAPAWLARGCEPETALSSAPRERMLGDLCGALEELASQTPLILIFEDLEWADPSTLNLISALARRRAPAKLMVLATYRPPKGSADNPLKELRQDLLMRRLGEEMSLAPLSKSAVTAIVCRELSQEALPPGIAEFVCQRAEGNPLFVIALLEHLIAERVLVRRGAAQNATAPWVQCLPFEEIEAGVPDKLAQMIELEIERLGPDDQRLLEAGSMMNVAFPAWAVAAALEKDPAETEEACDALARRLYFLERAGQDELPDGVCSPFYVFAHGLYREVLYRRQASTQRAKRHARIADRFNALFAGRETCVAREVAMHYEAAGDWRRASDALRAAALQAHRRRAFADAADLLERALRIAQNLSEPGRQPALDEIRSQLLVSRQALAL
jgi:predicted ATPase